MAGKAKVDFQEAVIAELQSSCCTGNKENDFYWADRLIALFLRHEGYSAVADAFEVAKEHA